MAYLTSPQSYGNPWTQPTPGSSQQQQGLAPGAGAWGANAYSTGPSQSLTSSGGTGQNQYKPTSWQGNIASGIGQISTPGANTWTAPGAGNMTGGDWTPTSQPGAAENYWSQNGSQFGQPGAAQNYWNGTQGYFAPTPTSSEAMSGTMGNQLYGSPSAAEGMYGQYQQSGAFTNPGQYEQWFGQNGNQLAGSGQGGAVLSGLVPQYQQSGAGENYYNQTQGFYGAPGAMEQLYGQHGQDLISGPGALQQRAGDITGLINGAQNEQGYYGSQSGFLKSPGQTELLSYGGGPQSSYAEDYLNGGGASEGLDSLYNRLFTTGARQLDDRSAAGGSFNSGASLRAQQEMQADLDAQHVKDYSTAINSADAAKMQRLGYGLSLAQGGDQAMQSRIGLGANVTGQLDANSLARGNAMFGLGQGLSNENLNNFNASFGAAQGAQNAGLQRVTAGQSAADQAFQELNSRLSGQANVGNMMNQNDLSRFQATSQAAQAAQAAANSRVQTGMGAANTAGAAALARTTEAGQLQAQQQQLELQRLLGGGQLAVGAGNSTLAGLTAGMNGAVAAQNAQQGRQNDVFNNTLGLANAQSGVYAGQTAAANAEQLQTVMSQIQALIGKGALTAQEQTQLNMLMQQYQQMAVGGATALAKQK